MFAIFHRLCLPTSLPPPLLRGQSWPVRNIHVLKSWLVECTNVCFCGPMYPISLPFFYTFSKQGSNIRCYYVNEKF